MPSPFPGMDPYIETAGRWGDFHTRMMTVMSDLLNPQLRPKYLCRIEERVYISEETDPGRKWIVPDLHLVAATSSGARKGVVATSNTPPESDVAQAVEVTEHLQEEVRERFLQIIDRASRAVVTTIELLSPANKIAGSTGRKEYEAKRTAVINSGSHLIEIDLLNAGERIFDPAELPRHDYQVYLSRWVNGARKGWVWPIQMRQRLPAVPVPLRDGDPDATLDLQSAVSQTYDRASYDLEIDYGQDPQAPLSPEAAKWVDGFLRSKSLRTS
jgi:hypothetical protein